MRLMMQVLIPVDKGNAGVADGSLPAAIEEFVKAANPEAAYFHLSDGKRAATFIFEEKEQAKLVEYNETFFEVMNAEICIQPVLLLEELRGNLAR
ncbi:hypothetical protein [Microbulbifer taiwanensis]|uniref:DUF3303 domain-containing protein n=1 Tax=Microbulbifer taiwanensis TaxID=986746 RepID=A0ABW1YGW1_9GAMM|nr:hypothetical protein [Microbulbifer taiwanensis]